MSSIGSLVIKLEANTSALQKVDAELAKLQTTIKSFEEAARSGGKRVQQTFGGVVDTVKRLPTQFQALAGVMALQSGALSEMGEGVGKVANKLAMLGAIAATGGPVGIAIAALSGAMALVAFANRDATEAAEKHTEAMKKGREELDKQRKAVEDLEAEIRALGKTKFEAARDEIALEIMKRERAMETARAAIDAARGRIRESERLAAMGGADVGQRTQVHGVRAEQEDAIRVEMEKLDLLEKQNAEAYQQIVRLGQLATGTAEVEEAEKKREKAVKSRRDAEREANEQARRALQTQVRLIQEAIEAEEERARKLKKITGGEDLAKPEINVRPRVSVAAPGGSDMSDPLRVAELEKESEKLRENLRDNGKSVGAALAMVAGTIASRTGELGQVMNSAVQGFQAGGPWGAVIAVFADLMTRAKAFEDTVAAADETLGELAQAFNPLAEAMQPLAGLTHNLIGIIADQLSPLFKELEPVFSGLFQVTKYTFIAIANVIMAIGAAWNKMVGWAESILNKLGFDVDFGRLQINLNGINRAIRELHETTEESTREDIRAAAARRDADEKAAAATVAFGDQMEELLNGPSGFKIERYRFESINPRMTSGPGSGESGGGAASTVIENLTINAMNVAAAYEELEVIRRMKQFNRSGSEIPSGSQFSTPDKGG